MGEKTILVIEDNEMNMKLMKAVFQIGKYRMLEAFDAETGIRLAREHSPDLILMDIHLPGMDGLSATRVLKADPALRAIPVVAVTGLAMPGDEEKAMDSGFAGYITKPFGVKSLLEQIAQFFEQEAARRDMRDRGGAGQAG
jgi:two-component system, cell cycle response regulator DivK